MLSKFYGVWDILAVPITFDNDQISVAIDLPVKFNNAGEVIATDDGSGTGIISLEQIGENLEFIAKQVL